MRKQEIYHRAIQIIKEGEKASAKRLSEETGLPHQDVHRCLNMLEKEKRIKTYRKQLFGSEIRLVSIT